MTAWTAGERVSVHDGERRTWGTVRVVIAGHLLRIQLPDGRRIWRRA